MERNSCLEMKSGYIQKSAKSFKDGKCLSWSVLQRVSIENYHLQLTQDPISLLLIKIQHHQQVVSRK